MGRDREGSSAGISNSLNAILTGAVVSTVGFVLTRVVGLGEKVLIARFFDPNRYGEITLAVSLLSLATIVGSVGLQTGVVRYIPKFDSRDERAEVISQSLIISLICSSTLAVVLFQAANWTARTVFQDSDLAVLIEIMAIGIPLAVFGQMGASIARGSKNAGVKTLIENFLFPISRIVFIGAAVILSFGTVGVAYAYFGAYAVMAVGAGFYVLNTYGVPKASLGDYSDLLYFSLPLLFANGMSYISSTFDTLLIAGFMTSSDVGIYNSAYPLARLVFLGPSLLAVIFTPVIADLKSEEKIQEIREIYSIVARWIILLILPGVFMLITSPDVFIQFVFGSEYLSAATALVILTVGFLVHAILGINGGSLKMMGHSKFFLLATVLNAIVNVALNLLLIPRIGINGAAIATTVSYVIGNVIISAKLYSAYGIHSLSRRNIGVYSMYAIVIGVWAMLFTSVLSGVSLILAVYFVSFMSFLGLYAGFDLATPSEWETLELLLN